MMFAAKRDASEAAIVKALKAAGYAVAKLSTTGVPDMLVAKGDRMWLVEVKDAKPGRKAHKRTDGDQGELTAAQVKWWREWTAMGGPTPVIVHNAMEAFAEIVFDEARRL